MCLIVHCLWCLFITMQTHIFTKLHSGLFPKEFFYRWQPMPINKLPLRSDLGSVIYNVRQRISNIGVSCVIFGRCPTWSDGGWLETVDRNFPISFFFSIGDPRRDDFFVNWLENLFVGSSPNKHAKFLFFSFLFLISLPKVHSRR